VLVDDNQYNMWLINYKIVITFFYSDNLLTNVISYRKISFFYQYFIENNKNGMIK